ncbi:cell adherance/invasion protein [Salmonella enterica subsp. arizonae]|nr:cell adherance/invasion protein [Salmonella enterica subsp. arizonae]
MKKFYSCLPVFLLIGCAQVPPPSSGSKPVQQPEVQKEQQANADSIDKCMSLPYVPSDLTENKHYQTKNLKIPHQKIIPSAQAFFAKNIDKPKSRHSPSFRSIHNTCVRKKMKSS